MVCSLLLAMGNGYALLQDARFAVFPNILLTKYDVYEYYHRIECV